MKLKNDSAKILLACYLQQNETDQSFTQSTSISIFLSYFVGSKKLISLSGICCFYWQIFLKPYQCYSRSCKLNFSWVRHRFKIRRPRLKGSWKSKGTQLPMKHFEKLELVEMRMFEVLMPLNRVEEVHWAEENCRILLREWH